MAARIDFWFDLASPYSALVAGAHSQPVKGVLRAATTEAGQRGIFGAPTFLVRSEPTFQVDGELFWGDGRLEDAVAWARDERLPA